MKYLHLRGGGAMPALGLGTYKLEGREGYDVLCQALELGYRHLDTAEAYGNEAEVGDAIRDARISREDIFVTTKVWPTHFRRKFMQLAAENSLRKLRCDYVDLLLLHWPSEKVPLAETLDALATLLAQGKARAIGVSNFSAEMIHECTQVFGTPLACSQIEYHALLDQREAVKRANDAGLVTVAHSPLAQGRLCGEPALGEIGEKYGRTAAQIGLRWLMQQEGVGAVPKAAKAENLIRNLDIFDFALSDDEMDRIYALNAGVRVVQARNPA
ncbi:aldo/keto reductase [Burkholderia ubonensis]|uniref:NADP-dependent oxidoreductase domain-containing protein n=1 Tax=Burkholderia ubonensis subsp. mesacidophila TaxID=265293 RepID=A0A2A4FIZ5_9BURK|nr:aldo/keto reductase [Burkholderia ubonensis]PCE33693.1 hypothetical protein BZL54_04095 [Burkholderia ubonensis subsp. mesacidophila]